MVQISLSELRKHQRSGVRSQRIVL